MDLGISSVVECLLGPEFGPQLQKGKEKEKKKEKVYMIYVLDHFHLYLLNYPGLSGIKNDLFDVFFTMS